MTAKAWDNVSNTTIKNCCKTARFSGEIAEPSHNPFESDKEYEDRSQIVGALWGSITHHFSYIAEISFGHFVSSDNCVDTESQQTEEEITQEALEAVQSVEPTSHEDTAAPDNSDGLSL